MKRMHSPARFGLFEYINGALLIVIAGAMFYPFWHVLLGSFMTGGEFLSKTVFLWVSKPTLRNFQYMLSETDTLQYVGNTLFITILGTLLSLFFTATTAYGLSRTFPGSKILVVLVVATMFLYPGLIPNYINFKSLGLINTRALLILINMIAPFYLIVMRSNFIVFPKELIEAAKVDGYSEYMIFFRIVIPLSKAILAAIGLFVAVNYWNLFLPSVFFITDNAKKTVQDYLSRLLNSEQLAVDAAQTQSKPLDTVLKMTAISIGITPIIAVYPFLQKYFIKGALIGAVKG